MLQKTLLALAAAAVCGSALADNIAPPTNTPSATLADIVVSATLSAHDTRTAPASVTLVPREELETRNATDLLDAVRGAPGITLTPRSVGGRKTLALRGLEGKHTLTLIDGRRIAPSDDVVGHSDFQYGWLPMVAIERIEIIRGPMSTLYGSEALGGVINLITRQPKERWIGSAAVSGSAAAGSASGAGGDSGRASVYAGGPVNDSLSLRVAGERARSSPVQRKEDPRYSEIEGRDATIGSVGATLKLTPEQRLEATWGGGVEQRFYDDVAKGQQYSNRYDLHRSQGSLAWSGEFGNWRGQLRAYRSEIDITNAPTNGVVPTRPQNLRDQVFDGFAAYRMDAHVLTMGGEFRTERLENAGLKNGSDSARHQALFAQDEWALGDKLLLTAGLRADQHQLFGSELSPRLYLVWEATPELVIKGGYGHAFKAPTLKQISPSYVFTEGPFTFLGNSNVKPEKSDSVEIGADWSRGPLALRVVLFHNEIRDFIFQRVQQTIGPRTIYIFDNVDQAAITGLETGFSWAINPSLEWSGALTLLKTRDRSTGKRLVSRPNVALASHLDWRNGNGWSARGGFELIGSQLASRVEAELPSYTLWNASVARQIGKNLTLRAGIDNIGDLRLAEKSPNFIYAERGRTLYATLRADF